MLFYFQLELDRGLARLLAAKRDADADGVAFDHWNLRDIGAVYAAKGCPQEAARWFRKYDDEAGSFAKDAPRIVAFAQRMEALARKGMPRTEAQWRTMSWASLVTYRCGQGSIMKVSTCGTTATDALASIGSASDAEHDKTARTLEACYASCNPAIAADRNRPHVP